jgi:hypothetical protein
MLLKRSLQRELDSFFKSISGSEFSIREVTKGALSQARAKLNPYAFIRLNEVAVDTFYQEAEFNVWQGHRVLAVDGTRLLLPNHPTVEKAFGIYPTGRNGDAPRSMAIASMLYDTLNQLTLDARIESYSQSEGFLLRQHFPKLMEHDLLLLDRGYPSILLMYELQAIGVEFCMRMKENWWKEIRAFSESGKRDMAVNFTLPKKDWKKLGITSSEPPQPVQCRLVRIELDNGEFEVLCTSLLDTLRYEYGQFEAIYHLRWSEEESYKLLKARIEVEDFSGKTEKAVRQDFHAKILLMTLCAVYAHPIEEKVRKEFAQDRKRKYDQQINHTQALATTRELIIPLFLKKQVEKAMKHFDDIVYRTREIIRPGRKVERKMKPKRPFRMNYKEL